MVKLINKSCGLGTYLTFKSVDVSDPLMMYFIVKNFDGKYDKVDIDKIRKSHKFKSFVKSYSTIKDIRDVAIVDNNGKYKHKNDDSYTHVFLENGKKLRIMIGGGKEFSAQTPSGVLDANFSSHSTGYFAPATPGTSGVDTRDDLRDTADSGNPRDAKGNPVETDDTLQTEQLFRLQTEETLQTDEELAFIKEQKKIISALIQKIDEDVKDLYQIYKNYEGEHKLLPEAIPIFNDLMYTYVQLHEYELEDEKYDMDILYSYREKEIPLVEIFNGGELTNEKKKVICYNNYFKQNNNELIKDKIEYFEKNLPHNYIYDMENRMKAELDHDMGLHSRSDGKDTEAYKKAYNTAAMILNENQKITESAYAKSVFANRKFDKSKLYLILPINYTKNGEKSKANSVTKEQFNQYKDESFLYKLFPNEKIYVNDDNSCSKVIQYELGIVADMKIDGVPRFQQLINLKNDDFVVKHITLSNLFDAASSPNVTQEMYNQYEKGLGELSWKLVGTDTQVKNEFNQLFYIDYISRFYFDNLKDHKYGAKSIIGKVYIHFIDIEYDEEKKLIKYKVSIENIDDTNCEPKRTFYLYQAIFSVINIVQYINELAGKPQNMEEHVRQSFKDLYLNLAEHTTKSDEDKDMNSDMITTFIISIKSLCDFMQFFLGDFVNSFTVSTDIIAAFNAFNYKKPTIFSFKTTEYFKEDIIKEKITKYDESVNYESMGKFGLLYLNSHYEDKLKNKGKIPFEKLKKLKEDLKSKNIDKKLVNDFQYTLPTDEELSFFEGVEARMIEDSNETVERQQYNEKKIYYENLIKILEFLLYESELKIRLDDFKKIKLDPASNITLLYGPRLQSFNFFLNKQLAERRSFAKLVDVFMDDVFYFYDNNINRHNNKIKQIKIMIENYNDYIDLKEKIELIDDKTMNHKLELIINPENFKIIKENFHIYTFIHRLIKAKREKNIDYEEIYEYDGWHQYGPFSPLDRSKGTKLHNKLMNSTYMTYYEVCNFLYENDSSNLFTSNQSKYTFTKYIEALHTSIDLLINEFFPNLNDAGNVDSLSTLNTYEYFITTLEKYVDKELSNTIVEQNEDEQPKQPHEMSQQTSELMKKNLSIQPSSKRERENETNVRELRYTPYRLKRSFGEMDERTIRRMERAKRAKRTELAELAERFNTPNFWGGARANKKRVVLFEVINCLIRPEKLSSEFKAHGRYELYESNALSILKDLLSVNVVVELLGVWSTKNQKKAIQLFQNELQTVDMLKNITIHFIERDSYDSTVQSIIEDYGNNINKVYSYIIGANDNVNDLFGLKYKSSMHFFYPMKNIQNTTNTFKNYRINSIPKAIMLSGYPGSGKSTVSKEFKRMQYTIIDGDRLQSTTKMLDEVGRMLRNNHSFVIDGTFLNKKSRKVYLDMIKKFNDDYNTKYKIIMIQVTTGPFESYIRNVKRSKTSSTIKNPKKQGLIPLHVYEGFLKTYQSPSLGEGFDKIEQYPKLKDEYMLTLEKADKKLSKYLARKLMKLSKK